MTAVQNTRNNAHCQAPKEEVRCTDLKSEDETYSPCPGMLLGSSGYAEVPLGLENCSSTGLWAHLRSDFMCTGVPHF